MIMINNPSLEAQLISHAQELEMRVDELVERLLANGITKAEILDSHKIELDRRYHKYRSIDKNQLMDLAQLKRNIAQKI